MKAAAPAPPKPAASRTAAPEAALQMIYALEAGGQGIDEIEKWYNQAHPLTPAMRTKASRMVREVADRQEQIEGLIASHAKHWRLGRMGLVDRSLLKLGIAQILVNQSLSAQVINESLKLAKKYSQPGAIGFLHGVLDAVAAEVGQKV